MSMLTLGIIIIIILGVISINNLRDRNYTQDSDPKYRHTTNQTHSHFL